MREATHDSIWHLGQILFGLHLLVLGYLAYRSGYVPTVVGALLAIAGLGNAADSMVAVLSSGSRTDISSFTFIVEFLLALAPDPGPPHRCEHISARRGADHRRRMKSTPD